MKRNAGFLLFTLGLFVLSGCTGKTDSVAPATTLPSGLPVYDGNTTFTVPYNATGCREGMAAALVTMEQAQKSLPEGFVAADAQALMGFPAEIGRGVVGLNADSCTNSELGDSGVDEATVFILIEHPNVEGVEPATYNIYELHHWTSKEESLHLFRSIGWSVDEGRPNIAAQALAAGGLTASGDVKNDEDIVLHTIGATAPRSEEVSFNGRFWHKTPQGLAYIEYTISASQASGTGSCSIRSGPAQDALGMTSCRNGETLGLVLGNFAWQGKVVNLPGVTVG